MNAVIEQIAPTMMRLMGRIFDPDVPVDMAARDAANPLIRALAIEMLRIGLIPRDSDELGVFLSEVTWDHPLHDALVAVTVPLVERRRAAAAGGSR
jgi:hypothetical protein